MKKALFSALFCIVFLGYTQAQYLITTDLPAKKATVPAKQFSNDKATQTFYLDYDGAEELAALGAGYQRFIWDFNANYDETTNIGINYIGVAFKEMFDPAAMDYVADVTAIHVDSVFAYIGHENNSGTTNTFTATIYPLDANGAINTSATALWTGNKTTTVGLSSDNSWFTTALLGFEVNQDIAANSFGVVIEYDGEIGDTAGIIAGFTDGGSGCGTVSDFFALKSMFYPNSFTADSRYPTYGFLPMYQSGDWSGFYYDCNGDATYTEGSDSEYFIQNLCIVAKVTVTTNTSIAENELVGDLNVSPNPATDNAVISYNLKQNANNVMFNLYDMAGRVIVSQNLDNNAGDGQFTLNCSDLQAGIYYYSIIADGIAASKKIVIE